MNRSIYLGLMLLLPSAAAINAFYFGGELMRFTKKVPRLESSSHIEEMKRVVGRQMYAALAQIVLLGAPAVLYFKGLTSDILRPYDVIFVIVPAATILIIAQSYKKVENRIKTLPTSEDELTRQRDAIVSTWLTKPFPNW